MPKREACRKHNIPRATLQFRLSEKFTKSSHGPSPILSSQEETILVRWIKDCQRKGFPRRKEDIQISVKQFLDDSPRENPFKNNLPGDGWYKAFMRRHPALTTRKSEGVSAASSAVSEQDIRKWFEGIYSYLSEKEYTEVLEHPERLFNADETNFQLCPQNKRSGKAKTTLTVLFSFSAAGNYTPPLIIYPGKRLRKEIGDSIPEGFTFATSDTGWMKTEIFYEYVANSFYPHLEKSGIQFPVILFVDGHKTHIDRKLSDLCTNLQIILVALYPNATRILQPADVSTFKPLKDGWRKGVIEWRRNNPTEELNKKGPNSIDFSKCLGKQKPETTVPPKTNNEAVLKFSKFKDIIGPTKVNLFMNIIDLRFETNEDRILYQLWKEFQHSDAEEMQEEATAIPEPENVEDILQTETGEQLILEANGNRIVPNSMLITSTDQNTLQVSSDEDFGDIKNLDTVQTSLVSLATLPEVDVLSAPIMIEADGIWHEISIDNPNNIFSNKSKEITENKSIKNTTKDPNAITVDNPNEIIIDSLNKTTIVNNGNKNIQEVQDKGSIDKYLHYPNTPQRKELKKQTELEEKENRKREREQKKVIREEAALERKTKRKQKETNRPKKMKLSNKTINTPLKKLSQEILPKEENNLTQKEDLDIESTTSASPAKDYRNQI
ncbi:hypothetical protein NQ317_015603 [Molorchus minor]|uniref:HTH CENPB-type domain-containing protein n=1 Tax=Molorchus minor TaxID=1323400 RepID=A0ABQ9JYR9_9CUCU|nr:hypothetical protein NQ317_015603 [Molorchus minor]